MPMNRYYGCTLWVALLGIIIVKSHEIDEKRHSVLDLGIPGGDRNPIESFADSNLKNDIEEEDRGLMMNRERPFTLLASCTCPAPNQYNLGLMSRDYKQENANLIPMDKEYTLDQPKMNQLSECHTSEMKTKLGTLNINQLYNPSTNENLSGCIFEAFNKTEMGSDGTTLKGWMLSMENKYTEKSNLWMQNLLKKEIISVKEVVENDSASVAITKEGSIIPWGIRYYGGHLTDEQEEQFKAVKVTKVVANERAFLAITDQKLIIPWGNAAYGGKLTDQQLQLVKNNKVESVVALDKGFSVTMQDNSEIKLGDAYNN